MIALTACRAWRQTESLRSACSTQQGIDMSKFSFLRAFSAAATLVLGGCVTATPVITPSGQQGFTLNCSAMNDIGQCYKKAGELCGSNGYQIYDQNNKPVLFGRAQIRRWWFGAKHRVRPIRLQPTDCKGA